MDDTSRLIPTNVLAEMLDLTGERIRQLVKKGIIQNYKKIKGDYFFNGNSVREYVVHLRRYAEEQGKKANDPLYEKKLKAEVKYKNAKARKAELETAELEGKMHRSEDVEVIYSLLVLSARNMLEALPARTAALVVGKKTTAEVQLILEEEAKKSLLELSAMDYSKPEFEAEINRIMRERKGKEIADHNAEAEEMEQEAENIG